MSSTPSAGLPSTIRLLDLRDVPLDPAEVLAAVDDPAAGGVNLFVGVVRDHDNGETVDHLDYTAHPTAMQRLEEVATGVSDGVRGDRARRGPPDRPPQGR